MRLNRVIFTFILTITTVVAAVADNGINSPYSRYGMGVLADQNLGVNRQMGGLGYALRSGSYINLLNPASFAAADTLTMLFDAGFSIQNVNFKEGNVQKNAKNGSFDYLAMQFRACKNVGVSIGFLPYSNVGYSFATSTSEGGKESTSNYNGEGGIYQPYIGVGWSPIKNLSVGLMASYIYGDISHTIYNNFAESNITDMQRQYLVNIRSYKLDFGAQYTTELDNKHKITFGATYSIGHDLGADAMKIETITTSDTTKIDGAFSLPHTFGFGVLYNYNDNWKIGADYTFQDWSKAGFFGHDKGVSRSKVSVGAEYSPNKMMSRNLLKKMNYRMGAFYAQPYTEVQGQKGCEEYGLSAGFSMPIINRINNRSVLHVSGQLIRMEPKGAGLIAETYLRLNIGLTFNESWFMKIRVR